MAKTINISDLETRIKRDLKRLGKRVENRLAEPTKNWNTPVSFRVSDPYLRGGDLVVSISTQDDRYYWLDGGTSVRHAKVSSDWSSKTSPKSFVSGAGSGRVVYRSKLYRANGITPREWTNLAAPEFEPILQAMIDGVLSGMQFGRAASGQSVKTYKYVAD